MAQIAFEMHGFIFYISEELVAFELGNFGYEVIEYG